jgi:hypothetical protein
MEKKMKRSAHLIKIAILQTYASIAIPFIEVTVAADVSFLFKMKSTTWKHNR